MVRRKLQYVKPSFKCLPFSHAGDDWCCLNTDVSVIGMKSVESCAPSSTPWRKVTMLCSESCCSMQSGLLMWQDARSVSKLESRLDLLAIWRMSIVLTNDLNALY